MNAELQAQYVKDTKESGIPPLELIYCPINDCYSKTPYAYRTATRINSVVKGRLEQKDFQFATDLTETGVRLAKWNVLQAINDLREFEKQKRKIEFISVRVPAGLARNVALYDWMQEILQTTKYEHPEKICLEFPETLLKGTPDKVRMSILDMKLLKVRTSMSGCASDTCPTFKLAEVPVDIVLLDPKATAFTEDRNKPQLVSSLVAYLRSMRLEVIAEDVKKEDHIRTLGRMEVSGYIAAEDYEGRTEHGGHVMTLQEAISLAEEVTE